MSRWMRVSWLGALAALWLAGPAVAQSLVEPGRAILRIETGMPGGAINRLVAAGDTILTVSDDKTLRRWTLPDGRPDGLWRVPVGGGDVGALYAVAVDGALAVVGGRTGDKTYSLFFFDLAANRQVGTIDGFAEPISALAFADAGRLLAIGLQQRGGLEVVDVKSRKIVAIDRDYGGTVNWLAFSSTGKLASSSADGRIRLYGGVYDHPAQQQSVAAGDVPWGLAFSPDGALLAVGSANLAQVGLYLAERLQRVSDMIGTSTASGALSVVAWNGDGSVLAAAGQYKGGALRNQVRFWPMRGGKIDTTDVVASPDTITDLAFLPDGTLAYGTAEGSFGILGFDGRQRLARSADQCDFRDMSQDGFALSADGAVVDFVCRHGPRDRFRADLTKLVVTADPPPRGDLAPPSGPPAGLALGTWRNAATVTVAGRAVALAPHEHVRSAAGAPGRNAVVLGTDFYLRLEQSGGERWTSLLPGPAWGVAVTADGRSVVAALGDGTIRWYDLADGAETASLYLDARDRRWVVGVPEGFFEHSVGAVPGTTLVGFQFNNGPNKPPNFVSGARLYDAFHRPDLVQARVRGGPDRRLVDDALARLGDVAALANGPSDGH